MFDIGFSEIALIAVVALLVLGPERLPKVARTVGALVRRARSSWQDVRSEIERELAAEDIKRTLKETQSAADVRSELRAAASDIEMSSRPPSAAPLTPSQTPPDERT
jgi:sec-independent protein translocase protein TatB